MNSCTARIRALESHITTVGVRVVVLLWASSVLGSLVCFVIKGAYLGAFWFTVNFVSFLVVFSFGFVALVLLCLKQWGVSKERVIAAAEMADLV